MTWIIANFARFMKNAEHKKGDEFYVVTGIENEVEDGI